MLKLTGFEVRTVTPSVPRHDPPIEAVVFVSLAGTLATTC